MRFEEDVYEESCRKESQILQLEQEGFSGGQDQELQLTEGGGWEQESEIQLPQWFMTHLVSNLTMIDCLY